MRQDRIIQASIFDLFSEHEIGRELKAMSAWLDAHREVIALVAAELCRPGLKPTGRDGLPAESVLRCALLKQYRQLSYQELAFHLSDSASFRAFARLPLHWCPKKSVLQAAPSRRRRTTTYYHVGKIPSLEIKNCTNPDPPLVASPSGKTPRLWTDT